MIEFAKLEVLRQLLLRPAYRPAQYARKEHHIREISQDVASRLNLPLKHINRIAKRRKSIETDPHRKQNLERMHLHLSSEQRERANKCLNEEIVVLKEEQNAQVERQRPD